MKIIDPKKDLQAWLDQEPNPETDILLHPESGGQYIPIDIIKPRLDILDPCWSTTNYKHFFFQDLDGVLRATGSVELHIEYKIDIKNKHGVLITDKIIKRTITGSHTLDTMRYAKEGNHHYGETLLSLCIVSAAKNIAPYFGKNLNKIAPVEKENLIINTIKNLNLGNPLAK